MKLDLGSFTFNCSVGPAGNNPSWGTALGQDTSYRITKWGSENIVLGMTRQYYPKDNVYCPFGKGGRVYSGKETVEMQQAALFKEVYVNDKRIGYPFIMLIQAEHSSYHTGRLSIKYSPKICIKDENGVEQYSNEQFIKKVYEVFQTSEDACWFVYDIDVIDQEKLILSAVFVDGKGPKVYSSPEERKHEWVNLIPKEKKIKFTEERKPNELPDSRQQIYYGAPGTGKSFKVKEIVESGDDNFVRTTFHPDSDYSTFVGCYKPTMGEHVEVTLSVEELTAKLFEQKLKGEKYPCHKFATNYWYSLSKLESADIKEILKECKFSENYIVEVNKGIAIGREVAKTKNDKIVYKFVPQSFLQAYVDAWRLYAEAEAGEEPKAEYLVIEEINRGNCAQIFGDLFQLLDRNEYGFSDYFINADQDLSKHLSEELSEVKAKFDDVKKDRVNTGCKRNIVDKVLEGEIMLLPSNLYILATMNTSDQSLFPIDSAFKRRWDWVYVPIAKGVDKDTNEELNWMIEVGKNKYDWWDFLKAINEKIGEATNSEDKKLGFFFCQAKEGVIDTHTFVNKVLFYLWNDVFKDLGDEGGLFNKEKEGRITFDMFHAKEKGVELVEYWIKKVMGIKDNEANTTPVPPDPANE